MNSQKVNKSFYLMSSIGCGFLAALFFVKILKNLATVSIGELAIFFVLAVCGGICITLLNDRNGANNIS